MTRTTPVPNAFDANATRSGIMISSAPGNTIGGTTSQQANTIAGNSGEGVIIVGNEAIGNRILGNLIYGNTDLGIDLAIDGVTTNDVGDADAGPNALQNFPVLTSALTTGTTVTIKGSLDSETSTTYRIEFFANSTAHASGHGEGERYLGFADVLTDAGGHANIDEALTASVTTGEYVTATATDPSGNTSEFAANTDAGDITLIVNSPAGTSSPPAGTNVLMSGTTINVTVADSPLVNGTLLEYGDFALKPAPSPEGRCYLHSARD